LLHDLVLEGIAYRLRPVRSEDGAFILSLRTNPALSRFLHPVSGRLEDQQAWFDAYAVREGDWYWIVEDVNGAPEGAIALYGLDAGRSRAECGRWILRPGSQAAVESMWLLFRAAFSHLGLAEVYCRTLAENTQVVSFHDSCGLTRHGLLPGEFEIGGRRMDAVEHRLSRDAWPEVDRGLKSKAERLARILERARG
jgi:RimJ/RimL family protein N-acetyltransferase